MKTNKRMMLALIGTATCSFFFGLGQHEAPAYVTNCVQSCCEVEYCWWSGGNGQTCATAQRPGATYPFVAGDNFKTAIVNIWVPAASGGLCTLALQGNYDQWVWPSNIPACYDSINKLYPNPQVVTPVLPQGQKPTLSMPGARLFICGTPKP